MSPRTPSRTVLWVLALLAGAATACASDSPGAGAGGDQRVRTIEVAMLDVALGPSELRAESGETVRFVFTNAGRVPHDAFIGDAAAQAQHAADMGGGGHHGHGDGDAVTVQPGQTAVLVHTFDQPGEVLIGCHQPGHYEAGMVATVTVV